MILALDPSSTRTGYALMRDATPAGLVDAGYLTPNRTKDPPVERIRAMHEALFELIEEYKPATLVVEIPSGKIGTGHRRRAGAMLAIYGMAVGAMLGTAWANEHLQAPDIRTVDERTWTAGKPKRDRIEQLAWLYPQVRTMLDQKSDSGGDAADAIGIAAWYFREYPCSAAATTS